MLTKKTSDAVLGLMTAGGDHDAEAVVSVARDVASRGWLIYFVDDRGRLNHCRTMDSVLEDGARAAILNEAVAECTAGGIDPSALLDTGCSHTSQSSHSHMRCDDCGWVDPEAVDNVEIGAVYPASAIMDDSLLSTTVSFGDVMYSQVMQDYMVKWLGSGELRALEIDPDEPTAKPLVVGGMVGPIYQAPVEPDDFSAKWSAQVRAKLAEREEVRRDNLAIRVQGEED